MILLKQTCGVFLEVRGKGASDVLLERERCPLERTPGVWKGCEFNPTDHGRRCVALVHLPLCAGPH